MRWILAACLFVATYAVFPTPNSLDNVYQGGWEYVYKYDTQLLTGLPTVVDQYSGFKVRGDARFQFVDQSAGSGLKVILKLDNLEIFKVHNKLGKEILPSEPVPEHLLEVISRSSEGERIRQYLSQPCTFNWRYDGHIDELKTHDSEPYWSVNFKKGIAHLLKVQLRENQVHYKVSEEDVLGRCDSSYTVNRMSPFIRVNKNRHMDTCTQKPVVELGLFSGMPKTNKKLVEPSVHSEHILYEQNQRYAIKEASLKAIYALSPTEKETDAVVTYTCQKLIFQECFQIRSRINADDVTKVEQSLIYVVPTPTFASSKYDRPSVIPNDQIVGGMQQDLISNIDQLLQTIVQKMRNQFIHDSTPTDLLQLHQLMRQCSSRDLLSLVRKYTSCQDEVCTMKFEVLLDCLPALHNQDASEVVLSLLKDRQVTGFRAALMINTLALTANPTPALIERCMQLYKEMQSSHDRHVTRSLMLCIGTLANRLNNLHYKLGVDSQLTKPVLRDLIDELRSMLRSESSTEHKLRILKTIGNFGEQAFFTELKSICEDRSQPWELREHAIFAMRKFCFQPEIRDQVLETVLPLYLNPEERSRVRTAAFLIVIRCRPTYRTFEMIGHKLDSEPNQQIKTFVYSVYLKLAKTQTEERWEQEQSQFARRCLKFITPVEIMPWDTQIMHTEVYSEMTKIGGFVDGIIIKSPQSYIPRALVAYFKGSMFGKYFNLFEAGVDTDGLESLVQRIIHWFTEQADMSFIWRILKNSQETISGSTIVEQLQNILNQLPLDDMNDSEFMALAYFKFNAHEMMYYSINKDDLMNLVRGENFESILRMLVEGYRFRWHKTVSFVDNSLVLPTPVGVPVYMNFSAVHLHSCVGFIQMEGFQSLIASSLSSKWSSSSSSTPLRFKIQADISTPTDVIVNMGSQLSSIKTGAATKFQIRTSFPINFEVSFDPSTAKVTFKNKIPDQRVDLFKFNTDSFTFYTRENRKDIEKLPLENTYISRPYTTQYSLPLFVVHVTVDIESQLHFGHPRWSARFPLMGKQEFYVTLNQGSVRCPTIIYEIELNQLPSIWQCGYEQYTGNYRTDRSDKYGYSTYQDDAIYSRDSSDSVLSSDFMRMRPSDALRNKCPAVTIPMRIYTEDNSATNVKMQLNYIRSQNWWVHQWSFQLCGKQLYGLPYDLKNIKLMTETLLNFENTNNGYPIVHFTFSFGVNRYDENTVVLELTQGAPEHVFDSDRSSYSAQSWKYVISLKMVKNTEQWKPTIESVKQYVQWWYMKYLSREGTVSTVSSEDEIKCYVKVVPQWEKCFIVFDYPSGQRYSVQMPWKLPYLRPLALHQPYSLVVPPSYHKISSLNKMTSWGKCEMDKTTLKTFDGHTVSLPRVFFDPECEFLVSRDCANERNFKLTMKPVDRMGRRAINVFFPQYKIEATPTTSDSWFSSWKDTVSYIIRVNDQEVHFKRHEPFVIRENDQVLYVIRMVSDQAFTIECKKTGLTVYYDSYVIRVEPSTMYHGNLCGLCGNHNLDPSDDMSTRLMTRDQSMKQLFIDNVISRGRCDPRDL